MPATKSPTTTQPAPAARGAASSAATKTAAQTREPNPDESLISAIEAQLGETTETPAAKKTDKKDSGARSQETAEEKAAREAEEAAAAETDEEREAREAEEAAAAEGETPEEKATREAAEAAAAEEEEETPEAKAAREAEEAEAAEAAKVPKGVQKRFDELTRTIHELKAALKQERAEAPAAKPVARSSNPFEQLALEAETAADIAKLTESLQDIEDQATAMRDGGVFDVGGEKREKTAEEVAALLVNCRRALRMLPGRLTAIQAVREAEAAAVTVYPSLADPESAESTEYATLVRAHPELARVPGIKLIVADARAHRLAREAKAKEAAGRRGLPGKPVQRAAAAAPALPGVSARRHVPPPAKEAAVAARYKRAEESGSSGDLARLIEAQLSAA
jgi:chemotaxis protein histidine kinase CheA